MGYLDQRSAFHRSDIDADELYRERFESPDAVLLGIDVANSPGFFVMVPEMYQSIVRAARADKELLRLVQQLPLSAIGQFTRNSLIDEIVLTNEIEGVRSTRREISSVLEGLEKNDKKQRFRGLVNKYLMLNSGYWDAIETPADVRRLYDELVLDEVVAEKPNNAPDGNLFRKDSVSVYGEAGQEVHRGIMPETAIVDALQSALNFLNEREEIDELPRIAAFHFLFGYIHPFYDGNGRTNRFISSQYLSNCCEPLAGYSLSFTVKERLSEYSRAFSLSEHVLNRGDITPFVILFCEIVAESLERVCRILREKSEALREYGEKLDRTIEASGGLASHAADLAYILVQAALFSDIGLSSKEIGEVLGVSKATTYKLIKEVSAILPLEKTRSGREVHYMADLYAFGNMAISK